MNPPRGKYVESSSSLSSSRDRRGRKRSRSRRRKHRRRRSSSGSRLSRLEIAFEELHRKFSEMHSHIVQNKELQNSDDISSDLDDLDILSTCSKNEQGVVGGEQKPTEKHFQFKFETTLKNETNRTSQAHLELLNKIQHFDSPDWSQVRFSDAQKLYNSTPGFVELETNDLLKSFDNTRNLQMSERSLAAITHALVIQYDTFKEGLSTFVNWLNGQNEITPDAICDKVNELFTNDDSSYLKVNLHILQMICGRRADIVQQRRDLLLNSVQNQCVRESLRKIPPSNEHLFNEVQLSEFISKQGGVNKVFAHPKPTKRHPPAQGGSMTRKFIAPVRNGGAQGTAAGPAPGTSSIPAQGRKRQAETAFRSQAKRTKQTRSRKSHQYSGRRDD